MPAITTDHPRRRVIGALLILAGLWGGLIPFVGPSFGFSMGGTPAWTWTESHASLHVAPAIVAVLGGALLIVSAGRMVAALGGLLATLAGMWFVIGPSLHPLWANAPGGHAMGGTMMSMGGAHTSATKSALEALGYHYATGTIIAVLGALALGMVLATRTAAVPAEEREAATASAHRGVSRRPAQA